MFNLCSILLPYKLADYDISLFYVLQDHES